MDKMTTPPTWEEAKEAVLHNKATPIHELIYYFQPPAAAVNEMSRQELFRGIVQDILSQRQEDDGQWQKADHPWNEYPIGTKARQSWECGYWIKTERGWKWPSGSTFPRPGAADQIMLPSTIVAENEQLRKAAKEALKMMATISLSYPPTPIGVAVIENLRSALEEK